MIRILPLVVRIFILGSALSVPAFSGAGFAQQRDHSALYIDTLATVGPRAITGRELIERIELMPWQGKDNPGTMDSAKIRALQSLAAEQILAMEAAAQGIVDDSTYRRYARYVEKLMVRDELYRREVRAKVTVSPDEVAEGLMRFARQVKALMINVRNESEAKSISRALRDGARPDSLLRARGLRVDTATVKFGMLEKSQEDAVYRISRERPVSDPVNVPQLGWVVLYYRESTTDPEYAKLSLSERGGVVNQKVQRRKEAVRARRVVTDVLGERRAEARPATFELLATTLYDLFASDSVLYKNASGYRLDKVAEVAEERLEPHLQKPLVDLERGRLTLQDVLEGWKNFDFLIPSLERKEFLRHLNGAIREVVAREYLTREGFRKGLHQIEAVKHDVEMWMDSWLASMLTQQLVGGVTVSDQEVMIYLVAHAEEFGNEYEVNIRELLSDSLSTSLSMLERIVGGEEFKALARAHSTRSAWAARGGESGWFAVGRFPEIGFRALESDTGKIVGPVVTPDGYSIFVVLGKRLRPGKGVVPFDSLRTEIHERLWSEKVGGRLDAYVAAAAKNYDITLYYDRLKQAAVSPLNMVMKRFIGFGGSMPASPGLTPLYRWVEQSAGIRQVFP